MGNLKSRAMAKSPPGLLSREFLSEYATWLVAPYPFLIPWVLWQSRHLPADVDDAFFRAMHHDWTRDSFMQMLTANFTLWLMAYSTAWIAFQVGRLPIFRRSKFNPNVPPLSMILTEMARSFGGLVVLTVFQYALKHAYPNLELSLPSPSEQLSWLPVIALYSDFHFYVIHRALHLPALYRAMHKVHHKSINTDPWSGLSMHPFEHVAYFSAVFLCVLPIPGGVPFWVTNTLRVSLIIYPIPAHIGYWPFEKHHWEHHTQFNYNYGSSMLYDLLLGTTFVEGAKHSSQAEQRQAAEAKVQAKLAFD